MKTDSILSKAEARVSRGYVEGLSGKEIADCLCISYNTVIRHTQMTERWPHRGDEIQVFDLTPEEVRRQNRKDNRTRRRAIIRCAIKRWLGAKF